ncbi:MAG: Crp/Fnr family transcriptional regulator [Aquificaceae bacterium]
MELKQELIEKIEPMGSKERFNMGDVIIREGEKADKVYVILNGHVSVFKKSPSGEDVFVGLAGPGSIIGEMGQVLEGERTATVRCASNVDTLVFETEDFIRIVSQIPEIAYDLIKELSKRINNLNRRIVNLITSKLVYVMGMYLLENVKMEESMYYTPEEGSVELHPKTFATEYNMEVQKVESVIGVLEKAGVISVETRESINETGKKDTYYLIKLNPDKLRAYLRSIAYV